MNGLWRDDGVVYLIPCIQSGPWSKSLWKDACVGHNPKWANWTISLLDRWWCWSRSEAWALDEYPVEGWWCCYLFHKSKVGLGWISFWKDDDVVNYSINLKWALGEFSSLWTDVDVGLQSKVSLGWISFGWMMVLIHNRKWGLGRIAFGWMMVWIHDHYWALDEYTLDG